MGVHFTIGQKVYLALWVVLGAWWCFDFVAWDRHKLIASLGLITAILGIAAQYRLARRNEDRG